MSNTHVFTKLTKGGMRHAEAPQLPGAWSEVSLPKQQTMSSKFKACCARWDILSAHACSFCERTHIFIQIHCCHQCNVTIIYYIVIFLKLLWCYILHHVFYIFYILHCVHSNSCISWPISFKFCMEVYLGKIYKPIVFGDAAPSVQSFIGSNVIFLWKSCVHSAGHISWWISFNFFFTDVHHSQIYTPIVFGDAAPSVPSFIGSKVIFWFTFLCVL